MEAFEIIKVLKEIRERVINIETKVDELNSKVEALEISNHLEDAEISDNAAKSDPQSKGANAGKNSKKKKKNQNMKGTLASPKLSWSLDWIYGELKHIYILCSLSPFTAESNLSSIWIGTSPLMKFENGCLQDAMHKKVRYFANVFKQSNLSQVGNSGEAAELSVASANIRRSSGEEQTLEIEEVVVQKIDLQGGLFHRPELQFWSIKSKEVCPNYTAMHDFMLLINNCPQHFSFWWK